MTPSTTLPSPTASPVVRVATFNIGRGAVGPRWGADPPGATFERLDEVAEALARLDPAVAALQEVHEADVPELVRLLADLHGVAVHAAFAPALPVGHQRLVRAAAADPTRASAYGIVLLSRAPIVDEGVVPLAPDGVEARVAQVVRTSLAGSPVTVVNVHLSTQAGRGPVALLRRTPQRVQTEEVLRLACALSGPVVVLGDWNQEALVLRLALWRAGVRGRLHLASDPWRATTSEGLGIDHVLVGGGVRSRFRSVERATVSDHRPVLVGLDLPG